jgi:hypothetical protein
MKHTALDNTELPEPTTELQQLETAVTTYIMYTVCSPHKQVMDLQDFNTQEVEFCFNHGVQGKELC